MCREQKGYCNLVDMPCWAHLLNKIGKVVFDGKLLPELHEYLRLNRLIFARHAFFALKVTCFQLQVALLENTVGETPDHGCFANL